jgi:multiple sugar transport system substrate-binding protein
LLAAGWADEHGMNSAAADAPSAPCAWTRRTWLGAAGATAVLGSAGCGRAQDNAVRFWAMGREGEVVTELLQGFYKEQPDVQVRVDQLPWSAAHEKLLTAFAGDATPDLAQLGNTWLPELVALGALEPLDALAKGPQGVDQSDYFAGIWDTNVVAGQLYGLPWYVDTRVLFYRRDLLSQAGFETPPRTWAEWLQMQHAIKRVVGPDKYATLLPLNEYDPLVALSLQQSEPLLREGGRYGNFRSADFGRTLDFYLSMYKQKLAPPASSNEVANVWNEFARGYFSFYITGPVEHRRIQAPPARRTAAVVDDRADAGAQRAGCVHRRRLQPGGVCALTAQGGGVEGGGIFVAPRRAAAVSRHDGQPAAAPVCLAGAGA